MLHIDVMPHLPIDTFPGCITSYPCLLTRIRKSIHRKYRDTMRGRRPCVVSQCFLWRNSHIYVSKQKVANTQKCKLNESLCYSGWKDCIKPIGVNVKKYSGEMTGDNYRYYDITDDIIYHPNRLTSLSWLQNDILTTRSTHILFRVVCSNIMCVV